MYITLAVKEHFIFKTLRQNHYLLKNNEHKPHTILNLGVWLTTLLSFCSWPGRQPPATPDDSRCIIYLTWLGSTRITGFHTLSQECRVGLNPWPSVCKYSNFHAPYYTCALKISEKKEELNACAFFLKIFWMVLDHSGWFYVILGDFE